MFFIHDVVARFALTCCSIIFIANVSLSVIFVPKLKLLFKYTAEELQKMNDDQLNALIQGFNKKFENTSALRNSIDEPRSVNPVAINNTHIPVENSQYANNVKDSFQISTISSFEDEISQLLGNVRAITAENEELKKENKELKELVARMMEQIKDKGSDNSYATEKTKD